MAELYIVSTPIGNLKDITLRALEVLQEVDIILAEDSRVTQKMLNHYQIKKKIISYHQHSNLKKEEAIAAELAAGKKLALVSDAGTPGISDPGNLLIAKLVEKFADRLKIVPIPGASAILSALAVSGFATDDFVFLGFPPHKKGRLTFFNNLNSEKKTQVFYESVHRILKTINQLAELMPLRQVCLCRELTKIHETIYRGTAGQILKQLSESQIKGEFVVVVSRQ